MKLIDILIENDIQWPNRALGVVQDYDGVIKFFAGKKPISTGKIWMRDKSISQLSVDKVARDHNTKIVTKQEWEKRKVSKTSKTSKAMFADVKVGDKAWDIHMGWGVVIAVGYYSDYPLVVEFELYSKSYTLDGYCFADDLNPSLFWDEIEIKAPPQPLPKLDVDTKVIVWDDGVTPLKRHFSHFNEDGVIYVFYNGESSFTSDGHTTGWDNWKLAE